MQAREPLIDAVRAVAMVGVVVGHWLVTAVLVTPEGWSLHSPLRVVPELVPLSWFLQTLGLFFLAGGYAAAVSHRRASRSLPWFLQRCRQLAVAVAVVLLAWAVVLALLVWLDGLSWASARVVVNLVTSPLWFLAVYLVLLGLTPLLRRLGPAGVLVPVVLSVLAELSPLGQLTLLFVWWAPWQLGITLADGWRPSWPASALLAVGGVLACVLLVRYGGYPASAVGGTEVRSNLNPPSPFALALAAAQCGVVLLLAPWLRRLASWRAIGWVNARALPIFLTHQSALVLVLLVGAAFGSLPGLHDLPSNDWVLARLAWIPLFAAVVVVLVRLLQRVRRST